MGPFGTVPFGGYFPEPPTPYADYGRAELALPENRLAIARFSPSFGLLSRILENGIALDSLTWRQFEELIADLLEKDGYSVELGPGTKDGGYDIFATRDLGVSGLFSCVWQAKKLKSSNKVKLHVIRELADTRSERRATKGIIATTTYLTRDALRRVKQDEYVLGKVDRDDLMAWIRRIAQDRRR
jgi:restriction endonuclease Mrr